MLYSGCKRIRMKCSGSPVTRDYHDYSIFGPWHTLWKHMETHVDSLWPRFFSPTGNLLGRVVSCWCFDARGGCFLWVLELECMLQTIWNCKGENSMCIFFDWLPCCRGFGLMSIWIHVPWLYMTLHIHFLCVSVCVAFCHPVPINQKKQNHGSRQLTNFLSISFRTKRYILPAKLTAGSQQYRFGSDAFPFHGWWWLQVNQPLVKPRGPRFSANLTTLAFGPWNLRSITCWPTCYVSSIHLWHLQQYDESFKSS